MWTRKELKDKAQQRFRVNYWKCILVALLAGLLGGGVGMGTGSSRVYKDFRELYDSAEEEVVEDDKEDDYDGWDGYEDEELDGFDGEWDDYDLALDDRDAEPEQGIFEDAAAGKFGDAMLVMAFLFAVFALVFMIAVMVMIILIPLEVFLLNPLEVGIKRFFLQNLREEARIKEICYAFDHSYLNCVKILFFRDLYIFLWCLLLVIPGIIKAYEYRMIPYILGENPGISKAEAFAISSSMMQGNKWKAFVLDLSFLGWYILNGLTLGILGIFYLNPYVNQTDAALYQRLKGLQAAKQPESIPYQM